MDSSTRSATHDQPTSPFSPSRRRLLGAALAMPVAIATAACGGDKGSGRG